MYDVITVGSNTLDVFAKASFSELIKIKEPKGETDLLAFPSGSKILIEDTEFTIGGGGTNTAFALSRLGHKVAYLGKIGDDMVGKIIEREIDKEKIKHIFVHCKGKSGYSLILQTLEKDRTILTYKGVNDTLKKTEVQFKKLKTKWFYFSSMMGESFKTLEAIAEFAEKNKINIVFNPSTYLAQQGASFLKNILSRTHMLVLNKEEAGLLAGHEDIEGMLFRLKSLCPRIVIITDGKNAINGIDDNFVYSCRPPNVKIVDTTGAGDAFASTVLAGLIRKKPLDFAIKMGVANACSVLSYYGAKNVLLNYANVLRQIKKLKIKVSKKKYI